MMVMVMVRYGMYAVLDPTVKLLYVETHWGTEYCNHAEVIIKKAVRLFLFFMCIASGVADSSFQYNSYRTLPSSSGPAAGATAVSTDQTDPDALPATDSSPTSIKSWLRSSVKQNEQAKVALTGHCQELHDYLNSPPVDSDTTPLDLVAWWGVSHVAIALALADANSSPSSIPSRNRPSATQLSPV